MAGVSRVRSGVHNLTAPQVTDLREAVRQQQAINDNRGYAYLAGLHGVPGWYCWHNQQNARSAQRMHLFLPWHRAYLYRYEMGLSDRVAGVTLPWWDWTLRPPRQQGLPDAFTEQVAGGNPLAQSRMDLPTTNPPIHRLTRRQPGPWNALPTAQEVQDLLDLEDWTDFTLGVEDIHNRVHGWVSGDMGIVPIAAYDPIFWSHHAMIDRIWWLWQIRHGNSNISTELLDVVLEPFNFKVRDVLNANDLGYDYAAGQAAISLGGAG